MNISAEERFFRKVEKTKKCWLWKASSYDGYGRFRIGRKLVKAHRFSYELVKGPIKSDSVVDHICRNRSCVNPEHLRIIDDRENILIGISPPAINARKTHCIKGHEFTPENTYRFKTGGRFCRECGRTRARKYMKGKYIKKSHVKV